MRSVRGSGMGAALALAVGLAATGAAAAAPIQLELSLSNPVMVEGSRGLTYLKVSLRGLAPDRPIARPPANVALVLDRSGSMQGEKIARAREAAMVAVDMLNRGDVLSVVAYDDVVSVLVPATRLEDKRWVKSLISQVEPGGSTALFAGVSKGAAEVRRYLARDRVNRVILLSDGLANVGPDSPGALGDLGASLRKQGISVTTIGLGLGYNEDLMARLARSSDGNHAFVESSDDLIRIFSAELEDILSVVAQNLVVRIRCPEGVRPLRVVGREADVVGSSVHLDMSQLYGNQEKYVLVELEVPAGRSGQSLDVADVEVEYEDAMAGSTGRLDGQVAVSYTSSRQVAEERVDRKALASVVMQVAAQTNEEAVALRDEGKVDEARALLEQNAQFLKDEGQRLEAPELEAYGRSTAAGAASLEDDEWNAQRKRMVSEQHAIETQQSY